MSQRLLNSAAACCLMAAPAFGATSGDAASGGSFDIVIEGGTVIDPDSGTHAQLNVGIVGGTIEVVSSETMQGHLVLDATDLMVAPGFIDVASYGPFKYASRFKVGDGVTTALSLHSGTANFAAWSIKQQRRGPMINYGAAVSHRFLRRIVGPRSRYAKANAHQIRWMVQRARTNIKEGALGISFSLEYVPGSSTAEIQALMQVAADSGVPTFFHLRFSDPDPPGTNREAVQEVIDLARATGAAVHIHHITSTGGTFTMRETIEQIEAARREGIEISANLYPYPYWATYLNSARFDPGWRRRFRIDYGDLQLAGTNRRLNRRSFRRYRHTKRVAVAYAIPEEDVVIGLQAPWMLIGSDTAIGYKGFSHPRGAGCFSRVIAQYVRNRSVLSLDDAVARMSLLPAKTFEKFAPALRSKGRLQQGMDADIVVFDAQQIRDVATVQNPRQLSQGIRYVLVNGVLVRDHDKIRARPAGKLITSQKERLVSSF